MGTKSTMERAGKRLNETIGEIETEAIEIGIETIMIVETIVIVIVVIAVAIAMTIDTKPQVDRIVPPIGEENVRIAVIVEGMIVEALVAAAVVVVGNMSPHLEVDLPTLGPVVEETTGIEEIEIEIEGIEIEGIEEMENMTHQADPIVPPIGEENAMTTAIVLVAAAAAVVGNMSPHLEVDLPTLGPVEETI